MNKVIFLLTVSDILILSAFGLITPIFAIFVSEGINGGSIVAAGVASTIFFLVKSMTQLPLSIYIDTRKEKLSFLIFGTLLIVSVPFIYASFPRIGFIYFAQAIYGLGAAMAYPAWFSLFTMYLDRKHRGLEWSVWSTGVGLGTALTAYLGAIVARNYGFKSLFYIVGAVSFIGMIVLFFLSDKYLKEVKATEYEILKILKPHHRFFKFNSRK